MSKLKTYASIDSLEQADRDLMEAAITSREHAYAPYSHFRVGASVLLEDGTVVTANNQENAAYPSGLCAERIAVFSAMANHPDKNILVVAITARSEQKRTDSPATSCGACRQVMLEYEIKQKRPIRVLFYGETGEVWEVPEVKMLLPFYFNKDFL